MSGPTGSGDRDLAREAAGLVVDADPSVTDWRSTGLSTSAQLRAERDDLAAKWERALAEGDDLTVRNMALRSELAKTQAALAASQSDLTAALRRESALAAEVLTLQDADSLACRLAKRARDETRVELFDQQRLYARLAAEHAIQGAELMSAQRELDKLRTTLAEREAYIAELREGWT